MKILFLSAWFPFPQDNGSKIRVYHLLEALGSHHDLTLLSFAFGTAIPQRAEPLRSFCRRVLTVPCDPFEENQTRNLRRFLSPAPVFTYPLSDMSRKAHSVLSEPGFDLVIASTHTMAIYALRAPVQITKVLEEHNSLTRMLRDRYQGQTSLIRRLRCLASWQKARYYEARVLPGFDLVTMVSPQDCLMSKHGLPGFQGRVDVVPNGVDCSHNQPGPRLPTPGTLVFNGSLNYNANYRAMQHFLAEIYPQIQKETPEVSLTITGSTTGVDLTDLRLDDSVRVSGYVDDVRPLVACAWACVVPIRQGGGTRLKILEAMALGTPVVSTSKGAEGLDVTPGQDILIADEPGDFAAQVVRLLRDPALRDRLSRNGRRLVEERYDWQAIGQRFVKLVESVVTERRAS